MTKGEKSNDHWQPLGRVAARVVAALLEIRSDAAPDTAGRRDDTQPCRHTNEPVEAASCAASEESPASTSVLKPGGALSGPGETGTTRDSGEIVIAGRGQPHLPDTAGSAQHWLGAGCAHLHAAFRHTSGRWTFGNGRDWIRDGLRATLTNGISFFSQRLAFAMRATSTFDFAT